MAIHTFKQDVRYPHLNLKFGRMEVNALSQMREIANRYENGEEEWILRGQGHAEPSHQKNNDNQSGQDRNN